MRRRITAKPLDALAHQALVDHKQATLDVLVSGIPEVSTFSQLGELLGYSYEWVRQRLTKTPERLYKHGKRYRVPRGVAEEFVRSVFT